MKKFNAHATINSIILLGILIWGIFYYFESTKETIVYVDNIRLFNGFNMTKDIKTIEESKINKQGKKLDSLHTVFQNTDSKDPFYKSLQQQIAHKSKAFQELQDNYVNTMSSTVWKRLNSYIKAYSQANNLKIVLGANGTGSVMYAQEIVDKTNDILIFSNKKYEGRN